MKAAVVAFQDDASRRRSSSGSPPTLDKVPG